VLCELIVFYKLIKAPCIIVTTILFSYCVYNCIFLFPYHVWIIAHYYFPRIDLWSSTMLLSSLIIVPCTDCRFVCIPQTEGQQHRLATLRHCITALVLENKCNRHRDSKLLLYAYCYANINAASIIVISLFKIKKPKTWPGNTFARIYNIYHQAINATNKWPE